jgi:Na+-translocating ferredoxin:NAD+ oxidoreductase subunit E
MKETTPREDLVRGIWKENPVLIQLLGLCPSLAVTNTVENAIAMAAATFFVLVGSSALVSSLKNLIPNEVRISAYILIIATFVTMADYFLNATAPDIHKALGAFIPLIVVNCIILGRQEAFASKHGVWRSVLDAVGTGIGFTIAMLLMGTMREVLGSGSFLGHPLFGAHYQPWLVFVLPPGGFFAIGFYLLFFAWRRKRSEPQARIRQWPHGVAAQTRRVA